jgi:hypothetical protein
MQGILTGGKGSVQMTSLYYTVNISFFNTENIFSFYKTSYRNEEVNRTEPFPSVRVSCFISTYSRT